MSQEEKRILSSKPPTTSDITYFAEKGYYYAGQEGLYQVWKPIGKQQITTQIPVETKMPAVVYYTPSGERKEIVAKSVEESARIARELMRSGEAVSASLVDVNVPVITETGEQVKATITYTPKETPFKKEIIIKTAVPSGYVQYQTLQKETKSTEQQQTNEKNIVAEAIKEAQRQAIADVQTAKEAKTKKEAIKEYIKKMPAHEQLITATSMLGTSKGHEFILAQHQGKKASDIFTEKALDVVAEHAMSLKERKEREGDITTFAKEYLHSPAGQFGTGVAFGFGTGTLGGILAEKSVVAGSLLKGATASLGAGATAFVVYDVYSKEQQAKELELAGLKEQAEELRKKAAIEIMSFSTFASGSILGYKLYEASIPKEYEVKIKYGDKTEKVISKTTAEEINLKNLQTEKSETKINVFERKEPIEISYKTKVPPEIKEEPRDILTYISKQSIKSEPFKTKISYETITKKPGEIPQTYHDEKTIIKEPMQKPFELFGKYKTSRELKVAERFDIFVKKETDFTTEIFFKEAKGKVSKDVLKILQEETKLQQTKDLFSYFEKITEQSNLQSKALQSTEAAEKIIPAGIVEIKRLSSASGAPPLLLPLSETASVEKNKDVFITALSTSKPKETETKPLLKTETLQKEKEETLFNVLFSQESVTKSIETAKETQKAKPLYTTIPLQASLPFQTEKPLLEQKEEIKQLLELKPKLEIAKIKAKQDVVAQTKTSGLRFSKLAGFSKPNIKLQIPKPKTERLFKKAKEKLLPSPIQTDVSKMLFGKATAPKKTKAVVEKRMFYVPSRELQQKKKPLFFKKLYKIGGKK
jgi:hypothetical protein